MHLLAAAPLAHGGEQQVAAATFAHAVGARGALVIAAVIAA